MDKEGGKETLMFQTGERLNLVKLTKSQITALHGQRSRWSLYSLQLTEQNRPEQCSPAQGRPAETAVPSELSK